jgi:hypothetical protein
MLDVAAVEKRYKGVFRNWPHDSNNNAFDKSGAYSKSSKVADAVIEAAMTCTWIIPQLDRQRTWQPAWNS